MSFVLVVDDTFYKTLLKMSAAERMGIVENNVLVLWWTILSEPEQCIYEYIIRGVHNGYKNMRYYRKKIRNEKRLLGLPTILIDSHEKSLTTGMFDYNINFQNDNILESLDKFRAEWYDLKYVEN